VLRLKRAFEVVEHGQERRNCLTRSVFQKLGLFTLHPTPVILELGRAAEELILVAGLRGGEFVPLGHKRGHLLGRASVRGDRVVHRISEGSVYIHGHNPSLLHPA